MNERMKGCNDYQIGTLAIQLLLTHGVCEVFNTLFECPCLTFITFVTFVPSLVLLVSSRLFKSN